VPQVKARTGANLAWSTRAAGPPAQVVLAATSRAPASGITVGPLSDGAAAGSKYLRTRAARRCRTTIRVR